MGNELYGCPDCGRGVSLHAAVCPGCGRALRWAEGKEKRLRGWKVLEGTGVACIVLGIFPVMSADSVWSFAPALLGISAYLVAKVGIWWGRDW